MPAPVEAAEATEATRYDTSEAADSLDEAAPSPETSEAPATYEAVDAADESEPAPAGDSSQAPLPPLAPVPLTLVPPAASLSSADLRPVASPRPQSVTRALAAARASAPPAEASAVASKRSGKMPIVLVASLGAIFLIVASVSATLFFLNKSAPSTDEPRVGLTTEQPQPAAVPPPASKPAEFSAPAKPVETTPPAKPAESSAPVVKPVEIPAPVRTAEPKPVVTERPVAPAPAAGAPAASPQEIAEFLARGDKLLATGDIAAARLFYERAGDGGSAVAMTAAGKTYDPLYLAEAHARGIRGDPVRAAYWYRKASDAGDVQADALMTRLMEKFGG
jgi:TPR repeat protein